MILGACPYCKDGKIEVRKKEVNGKKVELYACSNASWYSEDGEMFELTKESTCSFRIWQNALRKYGKYLKRIENTWKILQWASYGAIIFFALALLYTVMFL